LNEGKSPQTGERILKPESVDLMWENQIPDQYDLTIYQRGWDMGLR
jgi:hypothetical protein